MVEVSFSLYLYASKTDQEVILKKTSPPNIFFYTLVSFFKNQYKTANISGVRFMEKSLAENFLRKKFLNIDDLIWPEHIVENYLNGFDVVRELSTECTVVFKT